ncbi:MAG: nitrate reductase cytochrome c-type subunit [Gemmataceae bacterium]|nr:nitrate reductase cytochrome c-type subunit [Gemmataceae bacterium]
MEANHPAPGGHHADRLIPAGLRRFIPILATTGMALGVVGFVTGIREPLPPPKQSRPAQTPEGPAHSAVDYADVPAAPWKRDVPRSLLESLNSSRPGIFDLVIRTDEMKQAALADRAKNRAFDGAPPTIPHRVDSSSAVACLACHGQGLNVGQRIATKICHPPFSNCLQCHVEQAAGKDVSVVDNLFAGLARSGPGERSSPGAPPTIPHHLFMREDCLSCHGWVARPGIRTTHPWLSACTQCHVAAAGENTFPPSGAP